MSRTEPLRLPRVFLAGQATFAGCLATVDIPKGTLIAVLPESIELPQPTGDSYRCLLVFGEQSEGTGFFGGVPVPWRVSYHELMVAIPFVHLRQARGPYLFVLGMLCDASWAVWNGNVYYGFRKRLAPISWDGEKFSVLDTGHRSRLAAVWRSSDPDQPGQLQWIQLAATLPVLGRRDDGLLIRSQFEWDFADATIESAALDAVIAPQFRDLPLPEQIHCDQAYRVQRMEWRLSWPAPAGLL